jgi:GDPmannose 4,6-dehydratase
MKLQLGGDDYVIATDRATSVRDMCRIAFAHVGLCYEEDAVVVDRAFHRPDEIDALLAHPTKAHERLGRLARTTIEKLIATMVDANPRRMGREYVASPGGSHT